MEGPPLGPGGEDITWPDQVAPRGRKASSTRKIKPQTSNLLCLAVFLAAALCFVFFSFSLRAPVVSGFLWFPYLPKTYVFLVYLAENTNPQIPGSTSQVVNQWNLEYALTE